MARPLNTALYGALKRRFGQVLVDKPGEAFVGTYVRRHGLRSNAGWDNGDDSTLEVSYWGETYRTNCARCGDTRFRCYINHTWGQRDSHGHLNLFLMHCFNQDCWSDYGVRASFYEQLQTVGLDLSQARVARGKLVPEEQREIAWPGQVVTVDKLPAHHPAVRYLENRFYSAEKLGKHYAVSYCSDSHYTHATGRLIIPVFVGGLLRFWQARYIGELDWKGPDKRSLPMKYFSSPRAQKRGLIYNFDSACKYKTVVLVEGPFDVWGFGPMACCTLGSKLSRPQEELLAEKCRDKNLVILLDPEDAVQTYAAGLAKHLASKVKRLAVVRLPDKTDPGQLDRSFSREFVKTNAALQGVEVDYGRG